MSPLLAWQRNEPLLIAYESFLGELRISEGLETVPCASRKDCNAVPMSLIIHGVGFLS